MATSTAGQRQFPALIMVCILFLACLALGEASQGLITNWLPGISGLARLDPSLIVFDIPVRLPVTVDLIFVPALFLLSYTAVILFYPSRRGMSRWRELPQRLGAVFSGLIILLCCVAFGGLIAYLLQGHLPKNTQNGIESLGINADIYLPYSAYKTIHLHGNIIVLVCLIIGIAIGIGKIRKAPTTRKTTRLTREQRMTPYELMLQSRHTPASPLKADPAGSAPSKVPNHTPAASSSRVPCRTEHLRTLEPEAVNYRPLW